MFVFFLIFIFLSFGINALYRGNIKANYNDRGEKNTIVNKN